MEKTGEVLPIVPLIIVWGKKGEKEELNIHDLFPKDTPEEIMKYQMYIRIPVIYVLGIKEEDTVKGRSIFDVLEDLKVEIAADAKAKNLVDNVIKLSKAKNYSYEESLNILAEDEKEKEEALKRIKELEK